MIAYVQQLARQLVPILRTREMENLAEVPSRMEVLVEELNRLDPRDFVPAAQLEFVEARREARQSAKRVLTDWKTWAIQLRAAEDSLGDANRRLEKLRREGIPSQAQGPSPEAAERELENTMGKHAQDVIAYRAPFDRSINLCERIDRVLGNYAGKDSYAVTRSFAFVAKADMRSLVERDYRELSQILIPGFAWKSAVVIAGSILEAVLYDLLTQDAARAARAMASAKSPKKKGGAVRDITQDLAEDEWRLKDLIEVAVDLGLLPPERGAAIDQVLRDYRNFVHPRKELRAKHPCTEAEALLAKGALDAVCNHLQ